MVDLQYQIERLLKLRSVKNALLELHKGRNHLNAQRNVIKDFRDSILYKMVNPTNCNHLLTLNFFLDGAIVKRSGSESFWAALVQINEIPIAL